MNKIFTIGRYFGSGGHNVGKELADLLGINYYDKELITLAAKRSGLSQEILESADEKSTNSLLYSLALGAYTYGGRSSTLFDVSINDKLFIVQSDVIKKLATDESCVIVGRCADYVLEEFPNVVNAFIHAPLDWRIENVLKKNPTLTEKQAKDSIHKIDRRRASYYNYYSCNKWAEAQNYDICIDTSRIGFKGAAKVIAEFAENL